MSPVSPECGVLPISQEGQKNSPISRAEKIDGECSSNKVIRLASSRHNSANVRSAHFPQQFLRGTFSATADTAHRCR